MTSPLVVTGPAVTVQLLGVMTRVPQYAAELQGVVKTLETDELYWLLAQIADELKRRGVVAERTRG
jgi:hypothetical protein